MFLQDWIGDGLAKATVMLIIVAIIDRAMSRASAATRHRLWSTTMLILLCFPILSATIPQWPLAVLHGQWSDPIAPPIESPRAISREVAQTTRESRSGQIVARSSLAGQFTNDLPRNRAMTASASEAINAASVSSTEHASARGLIGWMLLVGWAIGSLVAIAPLLRGWRGLAKLRRSAERVTDTESVDLLNELCSRLGIRHPVELLESDYSIIPMTWGVLHPTVIVPHAWQCWSLENRRLVLLHELAHVKRYDAGQQVVARVACSLYWFHPLAWYAIRRLRIERELACDDCVLMSGERPSTYAKQLLNMARQFQSVAPPPAVAMAQRAGLEFRVKAMLDQARSRVPVRSHVARILWAASFALVTLLATMRVEAVAQIADDAATASQSKQAKTGATDQQIGIKTSELPDGQVPMSFRIRVTDVDGNPIGDANVLPWALRGSQGHGSWKLDEYDNTGMAPETATSGKDGIATIKYQQFPASRELP